MGKAPEKNGHIFSGGQSRNARERERERDGANNVDIN